MVSIAAKSEKNASPTQFLRGFHAVVIFLPA